MSTIGKFFIVLNLALAGLFVGSAASLINKSDSYRVQLEAKASEMEVMKEEKNAKISEMTSNLRQSQEERNNLNHQNGQLGANLDAEEQRGLTQKQKNDNLEGQLQSIEGKLSDLNQTNGDLNSELSVLRRQFESVRTERDSALDASDAAASTAKSAVEEANFATGEASDLRLELARETERANQTAAQLATAVSLYSIDVTTIGAQPAMEGTVTSVSEAGGATYVVIDLGRNASVRPGYTYDVFNGSVYKGRISVLTVNESKSAATVAMYNAPIAAGDRVVTRL
jgi:myosin heavy subunit